MDAIVAAPYGIHSSQKDLDYQETSRIESKIFPLLCDILNYHHGVKYDVRFWRIVLGHWFRRYIRVVLNRVRTLEQCMLNYNISGTTVFKADSYELTTRDSHEAIFSFNDDRWNSALYARILGLLESTTFPITYIASVKPNCYRLISKVVKKTIKLQILNWGYNQLGRLAAVFSKNNDAFIINSYLPKTYQMKLEIALLQMPQFWKSNTVEFTAKVNCADRIKLAAKLPKSDGDNLHNILCLLLFELLPICYLEGFKDLASNVEKLSWPNKPKFIFNSNNFDTDELFKMWAAKKINNGSKYIVGQHGNNYGSHRYIKSTIEEVTSDKFLTWGWQDDLQQHIPTFMLKTLGQGKNYYDSSGGLLLIEDMLPLRLDTWDCAYEFENYFSQQKQFVSELEHESRQNLTVRINPSYQKTPSYHSLRWRDFDSTININSDESKMATLLSQNRLIVHAYDSTGLLETLSRDIPTIAFWNNGYEHLRDSAKPYYKLLYNAGIIHFTPKSAASKVNEIWDDIEGWWNAQETINAKNSFCDRFAKLETHPINKLLKMFK